MNRQQKDAENAAKEPEKIQQLILSIQKEKENLDRYTNLENLIRENSKCFCSDREIENRQYSTAEPSERNESSTGREAERISGNRPHGKEKAETDFQKEKIDNLLAGVCKNCGNLEFLLTKIQDLGTQSEKGKSV